MPRRSIVLIEICGSENTKLGERVQHVLTKHHCELGISAVTDLYKNNGASQKKAARNTPYVTNTFYFFVTLNVRSSEIVTSKER